MSNQKSDFEKFIFSRLYDNARKEFSRKERYTTIENLKLKTLQKLATLINSYQIFDEIKKRQSKVKQIFEIVKIK